MDLLETLTAWYRHAHAFLPEGVPTGLVVLFAALANALRLARWRGHKTGAEPLVWILHLGYGWIAVGFALLAVSLLTSALDLPKRPSSPR